MRRSEYRKVSSRNGSDRSVIRPQMLPEHEYSGEGCDIAASERRNAVLLALI